MTKCLIFSRKYEVQNFYLAPVRGAKSCDERFCMFVCLSGRISPKSARPNFTKFSVHVKCGRVLVLPEWRLAIVARWSRSMKLLYDWPG